MRQYYQESNIKFEVLNFDDLEYGIDYEVVSETIFDYEGNEYMSLDEVPESLRVTGDFIAHPDLLETNFAVSLNRQINFRKAKQCKLGVIELLSLSLRLVCLVIKKEPMKCPPALLTTYSA